MYHGLVEVLPTSPTIYTDDFEQHVGPEWSTSTRAVTPSGHTFLGEFSNQAVTLTLTNLTTHTNVTISFDLFIIDSWDGSITNNPDGRLVGPDIWDLRVSDGSVLLHTTFSNNEDEPFKRQAYPADFPDGEYLPRTGAAAVRTLGYTGRADSVYRLLFSVPHSGGSIEFQFSADGLEPRLNESWGLDNVQVALGGVPTEAPPQITRQPNSQTVLAGFSARFSVVTMSTDPVAYQWSHNGVPIEGATAASLRLSAADDGDAGAYSVEVSNAFGSTTSNAANLTVVTGPRSQTANEGQTVVLHVASAGPASLQYQWGVNGVDIAGATNADYTLPAVSLADTGNYAVTITSPDSVVLLPAAKVTVLPFGFQEAYQADFETTTGREWSYGARAVSPQSHRLFLGPFGSGNSPLVLTLTNLPAHSHLCLSLDAFIIRTWDGNGPDFGPDIWQVRIMDGPTLIRTTFSNKPIQTPQAYPADFPLGAYAAGTGASERGTLGYPYDNTSSCDSVYSLTIPIAHSSNRIEIEFSTAGLESPENEMWGLDNIVISTATLPPSAAPILTAMPRSQVVCSAVPWWEPLPTAVFAVGATSGESVAYAWKHNGSAVANATNASLVVTDVTAADAGVYTVDVSNPNGTTSRGRALLGVVTAVPFGQTVNAGGTAVFEVVVEGDELRYQWRHNEQDLPGQTNATLTLHNVSRDDAGEYRVLVSNGGTAWESDSACLCVPAPEWPGSKIWEYQIGQAILSSPTIGEEGTVYVAANGVLHAIRSNGSAKWYLPVPNMVLSSAAVGSDGTIYVSTTANPMLLAIAPDGTTRWQLPLAGAQCTAPPAIAANGTVYIGMEQHDIDAPAPLWAVSANGNRVWEVMIDSRPSAPAVAADGRIYVGTESGVLYAVQPDGLKGWESKIADRRLGPPAIGQDGTVYVGCDDGKLYAVGVNGQVLWVFSPETAVTTAVGIGYGGTLFVGTRGGVLCALRQDGTTLWQYSVGSVIQSTPAVSSSGTAYFVAQDGNLYAVGSGGILKWSFATGSRWRHAYGGGPSPVLSADGTLYFGIEGWDAGLLYAITGDGPPADSPWPMFGHDARHTGRSPLRVVPQSLSVSLGANVTFTNITSESVATVYQWLFEGTVLDGATNSTLTLENVQADEGGEYALVVDLWGVATRYTGFSLAVDPTFTKITAGPVVNDGGDSVGGAWGDYDADGWLDLFVANASEEQNFLYHNNGDGTFTRITSGDIATDRNITVAGYWADSDNDGLLDLFAANWWNEDDCMYRGTRNGAFTKVVGLDPVIDGLMSNGGAWGDYDNDGNVDLFVPRGMGQQNSLYRGLGDGSFQRIVSGAVVTDTLANSLTGVWGDYDNDRDLDLFVTSEKSNSVLYRNAGGGLFVRLTSGVVVSDEGCSGAAWADCDNDGDLDIGVTGNKGAWIYRNDGHGGFSSVALTVSASTPIWGGVAWGDYDNDGWLDLFVGNRDGNCCLFRNGGDGVFTIITTGSPVREDAGAWSACWGDYDNDGFLDLFVPKRKGQGNSFYRNSGNVNKWLKVKLVGTLSNRLGIGARVYAKADLGGQRITQMREVSSQGNFSQSAVDACFGLLDAASVVLLRVEWPSGIVQEYEDVTADQFLTIYEPPVLEVGLRQGDGSFEIILTSRGGYDYEVEASEDFLQWNPVGTFTHVNGSVQVVDLGAGLHARRFYRAVMVP